MFEICHSEHSSEELFSIYSYASTGIPILRVFGIRAPTMDRGYSRAATADAGFDVQSDSGPIGIEAGKSNESSIRRQLHADTVRTEHLHCGSGSCAFVLYSLNSLKQINLVDVKIHLEYAKLISANTLRVSVSITVHSN